jgi:lipopolysaccharide/colanic/teichoic acid biosynthesis glycosyltransferase
MIQATEPMQATGTAERDVVAAADRTAAGTSGTVSPLYGPAKRLMDVVGAAVGLVAAAPVLGAAALAIKLDDGGPIVHRRRILGLGGRELDAFKLRTMRVDADAWLARHPELLAEYQKNIKLQDDPRITRVGTILRKLSIDELPQLVNVLRGEMSLVGPRMIHPSEYERFGGFGPRRLTVKPGVTGLWQVSGRQSVEYGQRVELDRRYIESRSLLGDVSILLRTVPAVLFGRGAH